MALFFFSAQDENLRTGRFECLAEERSAAVTVGTDDSPGRPFTVFCSNGVNDIKVVIDLGRAEIQSRCILTANSFFSFIQTCRLYSITSLARARRFGEDLRP